MSLTAGARLGVYEVVGAIGAGGMGEVYRATDTNLGRSVAIKVLPEAVASDPDRLARFDREARTLATLNHPNIAQIYGLEYQQTAGLRVPFLVMELVPGPTLADRIAQGRLPVDEALPIARQIADALEAAHDQGIIHRDLKPANIKVRDDGTVKVLDFGLAKALAPGDAGGGSATAGSMSPTITTPAMTAAGMILGTAAYMAPEQARGRTVDKRADIWAFGVVLFEMLTGRQLFAGEDISEVLSLVLQREPDFATLPPSIPPRVIQALRVCLRKDPKQRMGDMRDVRLALEGAFETAAPPSASPATKRGAPVAWIAALGLAVLGLAASAVPAWRHLRETPAAVPPETRVDLVTPSTNFSTMYALSPDGRQIVFVASGDGASRLWLRSLTTTTAQALPGTEDATNPFWSPDGRSIGFFAGTALKRLDLGGAAPQTLAVVAAGQGGSWNSDGTIIFSSSTTTALMRVPATGGSVTPVTTVGTGQQGHVAPRFLPDGRHFLFTVGGTPETAGYYLGTLDGGTPIRLIQAQAFNVAQVGGRAVFVPTSPADRTSSGWVLFLRGETLVAQQLDLAQPALVGEPQTLADGIGSVSASATGLVAYRAAAESLRQLTWMDRSGKTLGTLGDPDSTWSNPRVSPDGRRVAVSRTVQGNQDLWLLDGVRTSRFTFDPATERFPVWSPDGSRIVFYSTRSGGGDLYMKLASGAGNEEKLAAAEQFKLPTSWSTDGRFIVYQRTDPRTGSDLWAMSMAAVPQTSSEILKTPSSERFGMFSPDGRWLAYQSNESGRNEIYLRAFTEAGQGAASAGQWQISTAGGIMPTWRPDGKELYYLDPAGTMMAASIAVTGTTLAPGAPIALFPTAISIGGVDRQQGQQYDVARDGRFLINTVLRSVTEPITLLMNWHPQAKK